MCRRCSDCVDMSHHWVENTAFGDDEERIENNSTTHLCKHCDAMGDECDECGGCGGDEEVDADGEWNTFPCAECGGEGVVLVAGGKVENVRSRKRFYRDTAICASSFARIKARHEDSQWWYERHLSIERMIDKHDSEASDVQADTDKTKEAL